MDRGVWRATVQEAAMTEHACMPPACTPWCNNLHILYRYEPQRHFVKSPGNSPVPVIYLRYLGAMIKVWASTPCPWDTNSVILLTVTKIIECLGMNQTRNT